MLSGIILSIAKTHLYSRLKQSIIAALGVTFGIGMFIGMYSFMNGVNKFLEDLMLENTAHVHIYNDITTERKSVLDVLKNPAENFNIVLDVKPKDVKKNIKDGMEIIKVIAKDPHVYGISPLATAQVFYNNGSTPINGSISGVDMEQHDKLFNFSEKIMDGTIRGFLAINNGIIIGRGLAKKLGAKVNDQVNITTYTGAQIKLIVKAIYSTGITEIDNTVSYTTLKTVQRILEKDNSYITDINIKLNNIDDSPQMARLWGEQFGFKSQDWMQTNAEILVGTTLRNSITIAVSISLLIVAAFGIYNILTMMIYEKMNDIAILKATGFTGRDITKIFLAEALIIGVVGGASGLVMGFIIAFGISKIPFHSESVISFTHMPVKFDIMYYVFGMLFSFITTFLAGWFPARRASKVDPVEIIRGK